MARSTPILALAMLAACQQGPPEVRTVTNTVTEQNTVTNTVIQNHTTEVEVPVPSEVLEPGHFTSPLVKLTQVLDDGGAFGNNGVLEDHMHVDEVRYRASDSKLFYCAYTFGVIDASDPLNAEYMAQGFDWDFPESPVDRNTGCLHVDWDDSDPDIVYVSHRGNYDFQPHLTAIDIGTFAPDPYEPDETELAPNAGDITLSLREPGVSYEGLDAANGYVYVALHAGGLGVFQHDPVTGLMSRVAESGPIAGMDNAYDVVVVGTLAYVVDEQAGLFILDVTDPMDITKVGELFVGGVDRDLRVDGDYAYIAGGGAGLAIVDVSDPTAPSIVSYTETGGTAVRVGYHNNRVAVAAWNDIRVYDVTNRAAPQVIGVTRLETEKTYAGDVADERPDITARNLGVDLYNDYLFAGNWWTPYTFQIFDDRDAPFAVFPEDLAYMGVGTVELGQTGTYTVDVQNAGNAPLTIYDSWVTNGAFVVTPRQVEIPPNGSAELTVNYTATSRSEQSGIVTFLTDDPQQPVRQGYVVGNAAAVGVGDPFPHTEATDVNTLQAWESESTLGSVTLVAYFATF